MSRTAADIQVSVEVEIARISQPELLARIRKLLVSIRQELRDWDYGVPDERHPQEIFRDEAAGKCVHIIQRFKNA